MQTINLVKGFVIGGAIAAGVALLLAPKSGPEIRQDIKDNLLTASQKTNLALSQATQRAKDTLLEAGGQVRRRVARIGGEAQSAAAELAHSARQLVEEQA